MATATTTQQVQLQQVKPMQQPPVPIAKPRDPFWLGGKKKDNKKQKRGGETQQLDLSDL